MATRSFIGKRLPNGKITGVYCHSDGYPEHNGKILKEHYSDPAKVDALLELGSLSFLDAEIGEKHDFDNPTAGWTIAYNRDRGECRQPNRTFQNTKHMLETVGTSMGAEYAYVFGKTGKWTVHRPIR